MSQYDKGFLYSLLPDTTRSDLHKEDFIPQYIVQDALKLEKYTKKNQIQWFTRDDAQYHFKFTTVPTKPQIIYYMGNLDILNQTLLGIVGPRLPSIYGEQVVTELLDYA
ncbi:MAG: DNA-processing protein DprA, partial [Candidatus Absconditabacterales bacterium]